MKGKNIVSANKYSKMCGISAEAIYHRIESGTLKPITKTLPDGSKRYFVDLDKFPPVKYSIPYESRK